MGKIEFKSKCCKSEILANVFFGLILVSLSFLALFIFLNLSKFKFIYSCVLVLLTLAGIVFCVFVMHLKAKIKIGLALFLFWFCIILLIVESTLPIEPLITLPRLEPIFVDGEFPKMADRRSKLKVMQDLRRQGMDVYPSIHPNLFFSEKGLTQEFSEMFKINGKTVFPLSGISNVRTILDKESGQWQFYLSDENGFNNPRGLYKPGQVDILILGDSFAQGMGVSQEENLAGVIREKYPSTLTLGIQGMGPLTELAVFREYVESLKPKVVVWLYYEGNDLWDLNAELKQAQISAYRDPKHRQHLSRYQPQIDSILIDWEKAQELSGEPKQPQGQLSRQESFERIKKTLKLARLRILLGIQFSSKDYVVPCPPRCHFLPSSQPHEVFRSILTEVRDSIQSWGGKLYFVSVPTIQRVREGVSNPRYHYELYRDGQLTMVEGLNIPLIDLYPVLMSHPETMSLYYYRGLGHFNKKGYRFVAEAILGAIQF